MTMMEEMPSLRIPESTPGAEASLSDTPLLLRNPSFDLTKKLSEAIGMSAFASLNRVHHVLYTFQYVE